MNGGSEWRRTTLSEFEEQEAGRMMLLDLVLMLLELTHLKKKKINFEKDHVGCLFVL